MLLRVSWWSVRALRSVSVYRSVTECWHWPRHAVTTQQLIHWNTEHYDEFLLVSALRRSSSVSVVTAEQVRSGQDIVCVPKRPLSSGAHIVFHLFGTRGLFPRGLTNNLYLMLRLGMNGVIPPLRHMPSWHVEGRICLLFQTTWPLSFYYNHNDVYKQSFFMPNLHGVQHISSHVTWQQHRDAQTNSSAEPAAGSVKYNLIFFLTKCT